MIYWDSGHFTPNNSRNTCTTIALWVDYIVHDVWYNHIWNSLSSTTRLKPGIQEWASALCNDGSYQYAIRHCFSKFGSHMIPTQNLRNSRFVKDRSRFSKEGGNLNFYAFLARVWVAEMRSFSIQAEWVVIDQLSLSRSWFPTTHDDVIKWKHFPRYWPFLRGIHRPPVNFPHKGQWRGALMFSLISAVEQTMETQVIWDATALIMTS